MTRQVQKTNKHNIHDNMVSNPGQREPSASPKTQLHPQHQRTVAPENPFFLYYNYSIYTAQDSSSIECINDSKCVTEIPVFCLKLSRTRFEHMIIFQANMFQSSKQTSSKLLSVLNVYDCISVSNVQVCT